MTAVRVVKSGDKNVADTTPTYSPIQPPELVPLLRSYSEDNRHAGNGFSAAVHAAAADRIEALERELGDAKAIIATMYRKLA